MKEFNIGEFIKGVDNKGNIVYGKIAKVNKQSYRLASGALLQKKDALLMTEEEVDNIVIQKSASSIMYALKTANLSEFEAKKLEKAYLALFGKKPLEQIKNTVKKHLGF